MLDEPAPPLYDAGMTRYAVAYVPDLTVGARVAAAAQSLAAPLYLVGSLQAAQARFDAEFVGLVIVDLNAPGDTALDVIRAARILTPPPRTVGFCSHTSTARIRAAREAGADEVIENAALDSHLVAMFDALLE